jgi:hypothetical protein
MRFNNCEHCRSSRLLDDAIDDVVSRVTAYEVSHQRFAMCFGCRLVGRRSLNLLLVLLYKLKVIR